MGATSMKDMGKVMGVATKQLAGKSVENTAITDIYYYCWRLGW